MILKVENAVPEKTVTIRLEEDGDGGVDLMAKDDIGCEWILFSFADDGAVTRHRDVPGGLGFDVDEYGRIQFEDDDIDDGWEDELYEDDDWGDDDDEDDEDDEDDVIDDSWTDEDDEED